MFSSSRARLSQIGSVVSSVQFISYVAATLTALLTSADMRDAVYREKMDAVMNYMKTRHFPKPLFLKVLRYFKYFYREHAKAEEEIILSDMNLSLRKEVTSFLSHGIFEHTHLFSDFHDEIFAMLLPLVKGMHVHMNDKIFTAGSFGDEMYIIRNGEVKGMVPGVFISAGRQSENVESKSTLSTNKASFRLKSMMKRIKAMKKVQMRVSPKRGSTPEAGEKQQERETVGTGTLYHFTDGMLFGELVCCQCIPKRVYDAVAIVDTELYHINGEELFKTFELPKYEYVINHITRIAKEHVEYLQKNSKLGKFALEKYKMATFRNDINTNDASDTKMNVMGTALMNMIRKNKETQNSNQENSDARTTSSSSSGSNEMFEKIYNELKSISKRLSDLEHAGRENMKGSNRAETKNTTTVDDSRRMIKDV